MRRLTTIAGRVLLAVLLAATLAACGGDTVATTGGVAPTTGTGQEATGISTTAP
jgi:hypothetical protein